MRPFAELVTTTNFSFLTGASHPEELVAMALELGLTGIGIADRNTLAGVVRAHVYAREHAIGPDRLRVVTGARLVFADATPDIVVYPQDRPAYARLTRLLTRGNLRAEKGSCILHLDDLLEHQEGFRMIVLEGKPFSRSAGEGGMRSMTDEGRGAGHHPRASRPSQSPSSVTLRVPPSPAQREKGRARTLRLVSYDEDPLARLVHAAPGRVWIGAAMTYGRGMRGALARRVGLAARLGVPLVATNDPLMHDPARRPLADVVACIRDGVTLEAAGTRLHANAERHLKDGDEIARLFADVPAAVDATLDILAGITFSLDELQYDYPDELREGFATPHAALVAFTWEGAKARYPEARNPGGVPEKIAAIIEHELALIAELAYAPYFLTVHDIVRFARDRGILCQGRGSAANSSVCFCLGITEVDPTKHDLLFERFISAERREPPDIDVDFEHERREEVIQYIYARYGRERAGLAASLITYRGRSSIREVGKAFGLSEDMVSALSGTLWGWGSGQVEAGDSRRLGFDPAEPRLAQAIALASELAGFPRHLSQHTGGFVITRSRLDEVVPILNAAMPDRTTVEWDKDDLDALGLLKIDVLALGMLSCLRKGFELIEKHYGWVPTLATLPAEEACVYAMIQRADTIGVFQIESRAQMSMLPRLKPAKFYDLVIEVAIVRPGPIQGDMVHPYLRRREGLEDVTYESPDLQAVLERTLGVPLFQEQAMKIAIVAAGFTPPEADRLRRAMATFRRVGTIGTFRTKMIEGMAARGYSREFAERCFKQIEGFGEYGFPESHAASFALLVYASCWMKCRYPDVFAAALINAQPMGFYSPAQIVRDAREHGVELREVDVNFSHWDCTLEDPTPFSRYAGEGSKKCEGVIGDRAVRLGFRQIVGVREADMQLLVARRGGGYDSVRDLWLRTGFTPAVLERLAAADAFRSLGLDRRDALWAIRGLNRAGDKDDLPLFAAAAEAHGNGIREAGAHLPPMRLGEHVVEDYRHLSLSLKAHPVAFVRNALAARRMLRAVDLATTKSGRVVTVAGLVLVRQRPGTAHGVIFMTIEDETGVANIIVWPKLFERQRVEVIGARFIAVTGRLQNDKGVVHVIADRLEDLTRMLGSLSDAGGEVCALARADEVKRPQPDSARDTRRDPRRDKRKDARTAAIVAEEPSLAADLDAAAALAQRRYASSHGVLPKGRNFK